MTDYQPYRKGTVLAPTGPCNHLHVICNDPVYYPVNDCYCVLVVNISSIKDGVPHDPSCVLNSGDHRFIKHPSYVVYAEAIIWRVDNMVRKQRSGEISVHDDMPEATFNRILTVLISLMKLRQRTLNLKINIAYHLLMMSKQQELFRYNFRSFLWKIKKQPSHRLSSTQ